MSYQVDTTIDELEGAMVHLRSTLRGVPTNIAGFKGAYEKARKATGDLLVALTDAQSKVKND